MKLAFGTVQFGLSYGVTNQQGQVPINEVEKILQYAQHIGIDTLDTAAAYGDSETVLGRLAISKDFNIVTKVPPLEKIHQSPQTFIKDSCKLLQRDTLESVLLHHADDLSSLNGKTYYQALTEFIPNTINKLGISVYYPKQLIQIANSYKINLVQLPANWFDQRFISPEIQQYCQKNNIEVHARSIFLQGVLLQPLNKLHRYFSAYKQKFAQYQQTCQQLNCHPLTLALSFVHLHTFINKAVIGCCSLEQLKEIVEHYFLAEQLLTHNKTQIIELGKKLASQEVKLLNPALWQIT